MEPEAVLRGIPASQSSALHIGGDRFGGVSPQGGRAPRARFSGTDQAFQALEDQTGYFSKRWNFFRVFFQALERTSPHFSKRWKNGGRIDWTGAGSLLLDRHPF